MPTLAQFQRALFTNHPEDLKPFYDSIVEGGASSEALAAKADAEDVYTKAEVDALIEDFETRIAALEAANQ